MTRLSRPPARVRPAHVEWIMQSLSERDWAIIETVNRLRLVEGHHLERLHFTDLSGRSRQVVRCRVLKRLVDARVLLPLARRVGGAQPGSAKLAYALDSAGQWLMQLRANRQSSGSGHVRRPGLPGDRFTAHVLTITELYVRLVERTRGSDITLDVFETEPACWWPNGLGGRLKPDVYLALSTADVTDHYWPEIDLATESLPTVRSKLAAYVDFLNRGEVGPADVVPRVLVTVPDEWRLEGVMGEIERLSALARTFITVVMFDTAVNYMIGELLK
jgi:hypothetical protein